MLFSEFCKISKNIFSYRTSLVAASACIEINPCTYIEILLRLDSRDPYLESLFFCALANDFHF